MGPGVIDIIMPISSMILLFTLPPKQAMPGGTGVALWPSASPRVPAEAGSREQQHHFLTKSSPSERRSTSYHPSEIITEQPGNRASSIQERNDPLEKGGFLGSDAVHPWSW